MATFSIIQGFQVMGESPASWYVKRTDPDDHWEIIGLRYPNEKDAKAEADRLNKLEPHA